MNTKNILKIVGSLGVVIGVITGVLTFDARFVKCDEHKKEHQTEAKQLVSVIERFQMQQDYRDFDLYLDSLMRDQINCRRWSRLDPENDEIKEECDDIKSEMDRVKEKRDDLRDKWRVE